jgi:hypothetical protein
MTCPLIPINEIADSVLKEGLVLISGKNGKQRLKITLSGKPNSFRHLRCYLWITQISIIGMILPPVSILMPHILSMKRLLKGMSPGKDMTGKPASFMQTVILKS